MDGLSQYILNIVVNLDSKFLKNFEARILLNKDCCPSFYLQQFYSKGITVEFVNIHPIGPLRELDFLLYVLKNKHLKSLFYSPSAQYPLCLKGGVYTIHDLIYEQYPEQLGRFKWLKKQFLHFITKNGLQRASQVIAVSEYTKSEILRWHPNIKNLSDKIKVIHEGYEHLISIAENNKPKISFSNYLLYVGSSRGHKNMSGLLSAILSIKNTLPSSWGIVLVGNLKWMTKEQINLINQINSERTLVHTTGWLSNADMSGFFKYASAFVFPSFSEGFGIPVLESFYYKIPVICSNQSALPEVAGDAALYFNPNDSKEIGDKILFFIENQEILSKELTDKGTNRLKLFGWAKAAKELAKHINEHKK
jgi:glycosyltransferase involved in cell wall biosynthesis